MDERLQNNKKITMPHPDVVEIKGKGSMKTVFVTGKKKKTVLSLVSDDNSQ